MRDKFPLDKYYVWYDAILDELYLYPWKGERAMAGQVYIGEFE